MKKDKIPKLKSWEIRIGNKIWVVLSKNKPTIKRSKSRGSELDPLKIAKQINEWVEEDIINQRIKEDPDLQTNK